MTMSTGTGLPFTATGQGNLNYTTIVSPNTTAVTLTDLLSDANAKLTINGLEVASNTPSNPITLNAAGTTLISMSVLAQDGVTKLTYTITVSRSTIPFVWTGLGANTDWSTLANWTVSGAVPTKPPGAGQGADCEAEWPTFRGAACPAHRLSRT